MSYDNPTMNDPVHTRLKFSSMESEEPMTFDSGKVKKKERILIIILVVLVIISLVFIILFAKEKGDNDSSKSTNIGRQGWCTQFISSAFI